MSFYVFVYVWLGIHKSDNSTCMKTLHKITISSIHCIMNNFIAYHLKASILFLEFSISLIDARWISFFFLRRVIFHDVLPKSQNVNGIIISWLPMTFDSFPWNESRNHWCAKYLNLGKIPFVVAVLHCS